MRIFLFLGFALETLTDALKRRPIIGIEDIGKRPAAFAIALGERTATRYHEDLTYPLEGRT